MSSLFPLATRRRNNLLDLLPIAILSVCLVEGGLKEGERGGTKRGRGKERTTYHERAGEIVIIVFVESRSVSVHTNQANYHHCV